MAAQCVLPTTQLYGRAGAQPCSPELGTLALQEQLFDYWNICFHLQSNLHKYQTFPLLHPDQALLNQQNPITESLKLARKSR